MTLFKKKTATLIINLGTPDEPNTPALRRYLREFLSDPDVIDIPSLFRFLLVHAIIVPFRSPKSAKAYRSIWTAQGSPLRALTQSLTEKLRPHLQSPSFRVEWAMRYGNPSIEETLRKIQAEEVSRLIVFPLYPQFAQSTVVSTRKEITRVLEKLRWSPEVIFIPPFYKEHGFIKAQAEEIKALFNPEKHLVMSFHGVPERHILRSSPHCLTCLPKSSCEKLEDSYCYRGQCFETARAIATHLGLRSDQYSVSFQSRLGRTPWIRPATDQHLQDLLSKGKDQLVVACPSFVTDCLETLEEIGIRERDRFIQAGGRSLELVPCVNDSQTWIQSVVDFIQRGDLENA
jgi:protoporphyrin/coproporphyrin ferrochelatase